MDDTFYMFATVDDLKERWPDFPVGAESHAEVLLGDASQMIVDTIPGAENANVSSLRRVVCAMVKRAMNVADAYEGLSQVSETVGGTSWSGTVANSSGDLYLSKAERLALQRGSGGSRAYGVQVADLEPRGRHLPWCNLMWGATYCSCGVDIAGVPIFEGA